MVEYNECEYLNNLACKEKRIKLCVTGPEICKRRSQLEESIIDYKGQTFPKGEPT